MVQPIVVGGPTASGKSAFAMQQAKERDGEIICADSRQVFAKMRVGTAGPSDDDMKSVPHHGFHTLDPKETFDAGRFVTQTDAFVKEIFSRGKTPVLVGGTGLYLRAWRFGLSDVPAKDMKARAQLLEDIKQLGLPALYKRLVEIDEESAKRILPNDEMRIVRALEIFLTTGKKPSTLRQTNFAGPPRVDAKWLLLWPDRITLNARIEARTHMMFAQGLVNEALALRTYLGAGHALLQTMGYEEALALADGNLTQREAIALATQRQRAYAKRQITWFKKEPWWQRIDS